LFFRVLLDNPLRHGYWLIGTKRCDPTIAMKKSLINAFACCRDYDHTPCRKSSLIECDLACLLRRTSHEEMETIATRLLRGRMILKAPVSFTGLRIILAHVQENKRTIRITIQWRVQQEGITPTLTLTIQRVTGSTSRSCLLEHYLTT
jgi:hypothetical protein